MSNNTSLVGHEGYTYKTVMYRLIERLITPKGNLGWAQDRLDVYAGTLLQDFADMLKESDKEYPTDLILGKYKAELSFHQKYFPGEKFPGKSPVDRCQEWLLRNEESSSVAGLGAVQQSSNLGNSNVELKHSVGSKVENSVAELKHSIRSSAETFANPTGALGTFGTFGTFSGRRRSGSFGEPEYIGVSKPIPGKQDVGLKRNVPAIALNFAGAVKAPAPVESSTAPTNSKSEDSPRKMATASSAPSGVSTATLRAPLLPLEDSKPKFSAEGLSLNYQQWKRGKPNANARNKTSLVCVTDELRPSRVAIQVQQLTEETCVLWVEPFAIPAPPWDKSQIEQLCYAHAFVQDFMSSDTNGARIDIYEYWLGWKKQSRNLEELVKASKEPAIFDFRYRRNEFRVHALDPAKWKHEIKKTIVQPETREANKRLAERQALADDESDSKEWKSDPTTIKRDKKAAIEVKKADEKAANVLAVKEQRAAFRSETVAKMKANALSPSELAQAKEKARQGQLITSAPSASAWADDGNEIPYIAHEGLLYDDPENHGMNFVVKLLKWDPIPSKEGESDMDDSEDGYVSPVEVPDLAKWREGFSSGFGPANHTW